MGYNYSYVVVTEKKKKHQLASSINQITSLSKDVSHDCTVINFELDKAIITYQKKSIRQNEGLKLKNSLFFKPAKYKDYFPNDRTGRIGCIYLKTTDSKNFEYTFVSFTAATTSMSTLFVSSESIKKWFINFSKRVDAIATFIDVEEERYKFIYREGEETDIWHCLDNSTDETTLLDFYEKVVSDYSEVVYPTE